MEEDHLTNASIPGVRRLRDIKASTDKIRRDTTYTSTSSKMLNKKSIKIAVDRCHCHCLIF